MMVKSYTSLFKSLIVNIIYSLYLLFYFRPSVQRTPRSSHPAWHSTNLKRHNHRFQFPLPDPTPGGLLSPCSPPFVDDGKIHYHKRAEALLTRHNHSRKKFNSLIGCLHYHQTMRQWRRGWHYHKHIVVVSTTSYFIITRSFFPRSWPTTQQCASHSSRPVPVPRESFDTNPCHPFNRRHRPPPPHLNFGNVLFFNESKLSHVEKEVESCPHLNVLQFRYFSFSFRDTIYVLHFIRNQRTNKRNIHLVQDPGAGEEYNSQRWRWNAINTRGHRRSLLKEVAPAKETNEN